MKKLFLILLSALSLTAFAQQKKVAVYVIGEDAGINKVLGSKLVSAIARSEEYSAIERTESFLAELSKEQSYQRTGAVDDDELSRLGKQFGVQYVCVAAVSDAFNEKYLSARLIDVETAQVERTASSSGAIQSLDGIVTAANSIASELLSSLGKGCQSNMKKVAVYVVKNEAGRSIGRVLGDKLVAGFTNSGRYIAIERTNGFLSQLSKEQKYQRTGAVDDNDISRLGKQFGVQYVCVADISDVFGEKFISARLIDVETAEVVNTHDTGGEMNSMSSCLRMANDIAANLSKGTFKEQQEEARLNAEAEARARAEREAQIRAEREARERAEAEKRQRANERLRQRKDELTRMWNQGYVVIKYNGVKYMVCLEPININSQEVAANRRYSKFGYSDWEISSTSNVYIPHLAQWSVPSSIATQYVNNYYDAAAYNFIYIANEYLYYFNKHILKTNFYWNGPRRQDWYEETRDPSPLSYLDGNDVSTFIRLFLKSSDYARNQDKKWWNRRKALAFLVRRM